MSDAFSKTLESVVRGTRQLEEFATTLIGSAVEDVLLCVARDYGHDFSKMVDAYRDAIVDRYTTAGRATCCLGKTSTGKPCVRAAVLAGYCKSHAAQGEEEESKRRKSVAYRHAVKTSHSKLGRGFDVIPVSAFCVPKNPRPTRCL